MSVQPSIASYFGKRKRLAVDNGYKSKLLKTDETAATITGSKLKDTNEFERHKSIQSDNVKTPVATKKNQTKSDKCKPQMDIREALKKCQELRSMPTPQTDSPVKFQLLGSLSPVKKSAQKETLTRKSNNDVLPDTISNDRVKSSTSKSNSTIRSLGFTESENDCSTEDIIKSAKVLVSKIKETRKKLSHEETKKKELSLKEIKEKIKRSSKLTELKKSINKINQQAEELIELEKRKLNGAQPKLSKFKSFEVAVPVSPVKQGQRSPCKPAYERYAGLVDSQKIPLPFGYQKLYDFFCAADTICSMIINRGEILTFNKLKPAVEEMTRKTFTTRHLGQMATVYPEAYTFHQEKVRNYGSTSKADKYELVITPLIPRNEGSVEPLKGISAMNTEKEENIFKLAEKKTMTPSIMKKRKDTFYKNLLERTKDYHEEFLKTLDPPIVINRHDLKRWHPNFMVDFVPDVTPQDLPQAPNTERPATAKQVLERAKEFLSSNVRLHKALEAAAAAGTEGERIEKPPSQNVTEVTPEIKAKVDGRLKDPLKGVPKALLAKVRAKQAAKALDAMQMSPEEEKETLMYMRLVEMARIVRTAFINEQKGVLPLEVLTEKVQFSCNRHLGSREVEDHIRLLVRLLTEWLSIVHVRNLEFVKVNRNADVPSVMTKLVKIVEEKKKNGGKS